MSKRIDKKDFSDLDPHRLQTNVDNTTLNTPLEKSTDRLASTILSPQEHSMSGASSSYQASRELTPELEVASKEVGHLVVQPETSDPLSGIRIGLEKGIYPLDRAFILQKIGPLLPEAKGEIEEQLDKLLSTVFLERALDRCDWFGMTEQDFKALKLLGYDLSQYEDAKEKVFQIVQEKMKKKNPQVNSVEELKPLLVQEAFEAWRHVFEMDPLKFSKFFKSDMFLYEMSKKILESLQQVLPSDFEEYPPQMRGILEIELALLKKRIIQEISEIFFYERGIRFDFRDDEISVKKFTKLFEDHESFIQEKIQKIELKDDLFFIKLAFYKKWGDFLKLNYIQGFKNQDEVFHVGVCFALTKRVMQVSQSHPEWHWGRLKDLIEVKTEDRRFQAQYQLFFNVLEPFQHKDNELEDSFRSFYTSLFRLARDPYRYEGEIQYSLLDFKSYHEFLIQIHKREPSLSDAHGWMKLDVTYAKEVDGEAKHFAHALALRLDEKNHKAWIYDPNRGIFAFESDSYDFNEARRLCLECFMEYLPAEYPNIQNIALTLFKHS